MNSKIIEWSNKTESLGRAVVAIGVFDGVHLGHAELLRTAVQRAKELNVDAVAVTFDRDPEQVVVPDKHVPQLLTLDEKLTYMSDLEIDAILVVPFDVQIAEMTPEHFIEDVLLGTLDPVEIVVGEDFRFGQHAKGNVELLAGIGPAQGFTVLPLELLHEGDEPVTATRIRTIIAAGNVTEATSLLGRSHRVSGTVVHGRGEGERVIGVPTANITPWTHAALPAEGVYAGRASFRGQEFLAAISVGTPPSFPSSLDVLEAHLIGFSGDLYGAEVVLEFDERIRDQAIFDAPLKLAEAIQHDIDYVSGRR